MDDLISRQKALDHLRKRLIQTANNNVGFVCDAGSTFQDASERVKTWLDELPSIDAVPHWIPCEERLPKHGEYVFVYLFGDNPYIAWYNEHIKRWDTDEFQIDEDEEPVAWMPLPKPYERKEE